MFSFLIRRSLMTVPIIIGVTIIVFLLMQASGDPIRLIYGANVPPERVAQLREDLGLDLPIYQQYLNWVGNLLRGDLGISIRTNIPVFTMIRERIIPTLELTILALIITLAVSIPAGIISAVKRYSIFDHFSRVFALFWVSMPYFWLGIIFILIFSINLRWFPVSGRGGPVFSLNGFKHIILPSLTLGLPPAALFMRIIRSKMLEIINEDYVRTARSKGLKESVIVIKHCFRNALVSVVTLLGLRIPWLFGGAVITETVFSWPGTGRLLVNSIMQRDYPVVQGTVLMIALLVIISNILVDFSYVLLDPRIRYN